MGRYIGLALALFVIGPSVFAQPSLPEGLGASEPATPGAAEGDEWPTSEDWGEGDDLWGDSEDDTAASSVPFDVTGFGEIRLGQRLSDVDNQKQSSLAEFRLELEKDWQWHTGSAKVTTDLLYDDVEESQKIDLESGAGWLDLREAWVQQRLSSAADIKLGRQILTWGVGDLIFINDLFPKDWNSFLAGRDEQYLKAPSDAIRLGVFSEAVNVNLIYVPRFDADRYIDGRRLSFFSPLAGEVVGNNRILAVDQPDHTGRDDEWALRLYRAVASFEIAAYGYRGYWKSPGGFNPLTGFAIFPRLQVFGASARGPIGPGIFSIETGFYQSLDDRDGTDPFVNNDELRFLAGYEWELVRDTTLGLQYYLEAMEDYGDYKSALPAGFVARDHYRQLVSVRLTRLAMNQNLTLSLFGFYSPTDRDGYLRPKIQYKATDHWTVEGGFNLFAGQDDNSFFGQFEDNTNVYAGVRYNF
jgi:hypothetical protein